MIRDLAARMIEGLLRPRRSAERILSAGLGLDAALLFLVLAYLLQAMMQIVLPGARELPEGVASLSIGFHVLNIITQVLLAGVIALLVFGVGRLFGGAGERLGAFVIVAWHTLVTTLLAPVFLIGMTQVVGGGAAPPMLLLMIAAAAVWLWILAVYTAVLHRFRSPWGVMGVMVGLSFLLSALIVNVIPAA